MSFIVKKTTFPSLLDLISPHSCRGCGKLGEPLCERCKKYILGHPFTLCPNCKSKTTDHYCPNCSDLPPFYIVSERNELLTNLIHNYKYNSNRSLARPLAELISGNLPTTLAVNTIIIPLPTSFKHIRSRGFDHTALLAKRLAKLRHLTTQNLLLRATNTTQVGADRRTRIEQAESAYAINSKLTINPHATCIILDDVWTTGASVKSAIKKLRAAGVSNIIVTLLAVSRID